MVSTSSNLTESRITWMTASMHVWRITLVTLIRVRRSIFAVGRTIPWTGYPALCKWKKKQKQKNLVYIHSLLFVSDMNVMGTVVSSSCHGGSPTKMRYNLQLWTNTDTFPFKCLLSGYVNTDTGAKTEATYGNCCCFLKLFYYFSSCVCLPVWESHACGTHKS